MRVEFEVRDIGNVREATGDVINTFFERGCSYFLIKIDEKDRVRAKVHFATIPVEQCKCLKRVKRDV